MPIRNISEALDHADLSSTCISTSAQAMTILANEVRELRQQRQGLIEVIKEMIEMAKEDLG